MFSSSMQFNAVRGLIPTLAETGKIKIGRLGETRKSQSGGIYRLPEKLSYFLITTRVKDAQDNWMLDEEVHKALGDQPTEIPIVFVYDDPVLNCQSRLNAYDGSKRWCHGNNERALRLDAQGIYRERACPCPLFTAPDAAEENRGRAQNKLLKCKFYGVVRCQITCKTSSVGLYGFRTTSAESFSNLLGMQGAVLMRTGGILGNIPLRLRLYGSTDNTPGGAAKSWKVYLDLPEGGWEAVDEAAQQIVQARTASRINLKAIEANARHQLKVLETSPKEAEALIDELFPRPIAVIDGVEILEEDPDGDGGPAINTTATSEPPKPPATQPPAVSEPEKATDQDQGAQDVPPPPDSVLVWTENYAIEGKAGSPEVKAEAIKAQVEALEVLAKRKGYEFSRLTKPLTEFSRQQRHGFFEHLKAMPDVEQQAALPWGS